MPSLDDVHTDLEADRRSRETEIRLIQQLSGSDRSSGEEQKMLRRTLVLLTYAHLEGYTKFALLAYASAINSQNITCADAATPIAAASLSKVFAGLRNAQHKHSFFRKVLPEDSKLHLIAREQKFVDGFEEVRGMRVDIPDSLIDTQSNLTPDVLRKLLFQLGLPFSKVDEHQGAISKLLGVRNHIAHGDRLKVPTEQESAEYVDSALAVMAFLHSEIFAALSANAYRRTAVTG